MAFNSPSPIKIRLEAEDGLLSAIGERLIETLGDKFQLEGVPQIDSAVAKYAPNWNRAAEYGNVRLMLMDMDSLAHPQDKRKCPETKIKQILGGEPLSPNFLLRIAVFESESWLMADWSAWKRFFKLDDREPLKVDELKHAKEVAYDMIKRSNPHQKLKPPNLLYKFTQTKWCPREAARHSKSLRQTLDRLEAFSPLGND